MLNQLPTQIFDFVSEEKIGHLTIMTNKGVIALPIAYYCDSENIIFGTPKNSSKMKFLQKNSRVSFSVDNGKFFDESLGVIVEGISETFSSKTLFKNLLSAIRATNGFHKKYPDLVKTYIASIEELSDQRKSYKYVFNRIKPSKVTYWKGSNFGVITSNVTKHEITLETKYNDDPVFHAKKVMDYYNFLELTSSDQHDYILDHLASDFIVENFQDVQSKKNLDIMTILSLPEKMRKVGIAVLELNNGTIDDIVVNLGIPKTEARNCLNRLISLKLVIKKRDNNKIVYMPRFHN